MYIIGLGFFLIIWKTSKALLFLRHPIIYCTFNLYLSSQGGIYDYNITVFTFNFRSTLELLSNQSIWHLVLFTILQHLFSITRKIPSWYTIKWLVYEAKLLVLCDFLNEAQNSFCVESSGGKEDLAVSLWHSDLKYL